MKMVAIAAVMSLLLLYVWERVDLVRVGYEVQQLKAKHRTLERVNDELKVKVSALTSPERIARLATERLGMVRPQPGQVVLVSLVSDTPAPRGTMAAEVRLAKHDIGW
jgi:cell division protein FtsL